MLLLILFPQNGRSPTLRTYNSGAKVQIKIERTKKKGEKLASCSLDIYLYLIINPFLPIVSFRYPYYALS